MNDPLSQAFPEPVFLPFEDMKRVDLQRFKRWEGWLLMTGIRAYRTGLIGLPVAMDLLEEARNFVTALHAGSVADVEDHGSPLARMPAMPRVWPEEFPVELAKAFVGYLSTVSIRPDDW